MRKFYHKWFYFILFCPLWFLIIGNYSQHTLFSRGPLAVGFVEDYPALWLTAVGLILYATILRHYIGVIEKENILKFRGISLYIPLIFALIFSFLINHQWVMSQLNNMTITWTTYKGSLPYFFETAEQFNLVGYIYYLTCFVSWTIHVIAALYLIISLLVWKVKDLQVDTKAYYAGSFYVVCSYFFYLLGLEVNDLILEGLETFSLHPNRWMMLLVFLILLLALSAIRTSTDHTLYKSYAQKEFLGDTFILLIPFLFITINRSLIGLGGVGGQVRLLISLGSFAIATFLIGINLYLKNKRVILFNYLQNEQNTLEEYTQSLETLYHEMRTFKHDTHNILLAVESYIEADDLEGLKTFYNKKKTPYGNVQYDLLHQLMHIKEPALKGLLMRKLGNLSSQELFLEVHIHKFIIDIETIDLIRIIGILLDNAIEAAKASASKKIIINMVDDHLLIGNSYSGKVNKSMLKGNFTSKGENRGIGLGSLKQLLKNYPNYHLKTSITDTLFIQKIESKES